MKFTCYQLYLNISLPGITVILYKTCRHHHMHTAQVVDMEMIYDK